MKHTRAHPRHACVLIESIHAIFSWNFFYSIFFRSLSLFWHSFHFRHLFNAHNYIYYSNGKMNISAQSSQRNLFCWIILFVEPISVLWHQKFSLYAHICMDESVSKNHDTDPIRYHCFDVKYKFIQYTTQC